MKGLLKTLFFLIAGTAFAQPYPSKPIRVIVPFSPGGPVDVVMRLLSPKMTEMLGQPLVIENKTGAGGNLGVQQAARAPADGYTVLATSSSFAVNPALTPDAGYNPDKDFIAAACLAPRRADAERARLPRHGGLHLGRAVPARRDTRRDCAEAERRGDPDGAKRRHPRAAGRAYLRADGGAAARDGRLREERAGEVGQGGSRYRREGRMRFVLDVQQDLGSGGLGLRVDRVRVRDDQIRALRFEAIDLVGLPDQLSPLGILSGNRAEHDHAVAKTQLSVRDRAVRIGVDGVPLETKGRTQPFNRGRRVPVAKGGNDCRLRALGKGRHEVVLCLRSMKEQQAATASLPSREYSRGCAPREACPNAPVALAYPPTRD